MTKSTAKMGAVAAWILIGISVASMILSEWYIRSVLMPRARELDSSLWGLGHDELDAPMTLSLVSFFAFPYAIVWTLLCLYRGRQRAALASLFAAAAAFAACFWRIAQGMYFLD